MTNKHECGQALNTDAMKMAYYFERDKLTGVYCLYVRENGGRPHRVSINYESVKTAVDRDNVLRQIMSDNRNFETRLYSFHYSPIVEVPLYVWFTAWAVVTSLAVCVIFEISK